MLTDIFLNRYPNIWHFTQGVPREVAVFLRQAAQIIFQDLKPHMTDPEAVCQRAYDKLVRELGFGLYNGRTYVESCTEALCQLYDLYNNSHQPPEGFAMRQVSLVELLFAETEADFIQQRVSPKRSIFRKSPPGPDAMANLRKVVVQEAIHEMNQRLREAQISLHYHSGVFQISSDEVTEAQVSEPFWKLVQDPKWKNVDTDMKEAIDRRDQKGRDSALYAMKALESTIKIISDENDWSRGKENGAASYVDNLVSSKNGRFVEVWESEQLKSLFKELRNPHGHGPGSGTQPTLLEHQESWVIECAMIWIKSLISRT